MSLLNKVVCYFDTTVRKVVIQNLPFLLILCVYTKTSHQLVESFKSTLDEKCESQFYDSFGRYINPNFEGHISVVNKTISKIGAQDKPMILIFNKLTHIPYVKEQDDLTPVTKENYTRRLKRFMDV